MGLRDAVTRDFGSAQRNFEGLDARLALAEAGMLGGTITLAATTAPSTPAAGSVVIYAATTGGQTVIMAINASTSTQLWP